MLGDGFFKSCGCARGLCNCELPTPKLSLAIQSTVRDVQRMELKVLNQELEIASLRSELNKLSKSKKEDAEWIALGLVKKKELEVLDNNRETLLVRKKMKEIINTNSEVLTKEKLAQILDIYMEVDPSECFALISCVIRSGDE